MTGLRRLRSGEARLVLVVLGYVALALLALAVVVWAALTPSQRDDLGAALAGQAATFVLGGVAAGAGLAWLLLRGPGAYPVRARRMTADVRLLLGANAEHRLDDDGPAELVELAAAVNALADRRAELERHVGRQVAEARADVERERNRLAALMSELSVAVLVCSRGGRVLLYNPAARALLGDDPALGLGRSVFGLLDRDLVAHALDRLATGELPVHVSTVLRGSDLLTVRLTPVRDEADGEGGPAGFVVVLEDTRHLQETRRRDAELRALAERTRSSVASVRAAVETVLDFPDMAAGERSRFLEIVREESERLGRHVDALSAETAVATDWLLTDLAGADLLALVRRELERGGAAVTTGAADDAWVRVDSHALTRALVALCAHAGAPAVELSLAVDGAHVRLDARWPGPPPAPDALAGWLDEPLPGGVAASAREVVARHDAEVWTTTEDGAAVLRLLLPAAAPADRRPVSRPPRTAARPEFYDFDLFDLPAHAAALSDRPLAELAFTVLDTETTGFDAGADEIVAVGAVHVVGGRLRAHETFDRLVDPRRPVPETSTAVHGITTEMVRGQATVEEVLPQLARFAEDTVLVGHNVAFDLAFLRAREKRTGARFATPALDTLLLDVVLHPDHAAHSLDAVAERLGVDVVGRHTAIGDALVTAEVLVRQLALLQQRGITTLGQALDAARATVRERSREA